MYKAHDIHEAAASEQAHVARANQGQTSGTIGVYRIGQLGDAVVAMPAMTLIRSQHAQERIVLITDEPPHPGAATTASVLAAAGLVDDVITYATAAARYHRLTNALSTAARIRASRVRRLYYLAPQPRAARQIWRDWVYFRIVCGIANIVGLRDAWARWLPMSQSGTPARLEPEASRLLRVVNKGEMPLGASPTMPLPTHARMAAERLLTAEGIGNDARLIAISPGSKMLAKRWPLARYVEVGRAILAMDPNVHLIAVAGADEYELCQELASQCGARATNLAGRTTIIESAALLARCALYLGNDTGTMHLAAAVGTPCLALFSARDNPGKWEPGGHGHVILRRDVECSGCMLETCERERMRCLTEISVDEVIYHASVQLAATSTNNKPGHV